VVTAPAPVAQVSRWSRGPEANSVPRWSWWPGRLRRWAFSWRKLTTFATRIHRQCRRYRRCWRDRLCSNRVLPYENVWAQRCRWRGGGSSAPGTLRQMRHRLRKWRRLTRPGGSCDRDGLCLSSGAGAVGGGGGGLNNAHASVTTTTIARNYAGQGGAPNINTQVGN